MSGKSKRARRPPSAGRMRQHRRPFRSPRRCGEENLDRGKRKTGNLTALVKRRHELRARAPVGRDHHLLDFLGADDAFSGKVHERPDQGIDHQPIAEIVGVGLGHGQHDELTARPQLVGAMNEEGVPVFRGLAGEGGAGVCVVAIGDLHLIGD